MKAPPLLARVRWLPLVALFVVSLPAVTPRIYASDEAEYYAFLRSLWFDRDLSFDNEYRHFYDAGLWRAAGFRETFLERTTEIGRRLNFATIGCAILWAPFYAAGDATARVMAAAGSSVPVDGYSRPYITAVAYGSAFYGFAAVVLSAAIAARLVGQGTRAALAVWIGTPLLFYMYVAPPMSHACSAFAVAIFLTAWLHVRGSWSMRGTIGLGLLAGLMAMVREQDAFVAIGPAIDFAWTTIARARQGGRADVRRLVRAGAAGAVATAIAFIPQLLAYVAINGHPGPSRLVSRKMTWSAPHALEVLLSPNHGFFFWTPLAIPALTGLVWLAFARRTGARNHDPVVAGMKLRPAAVETGRVTELVTTEITAPTDARRIALVALVIVALQIYVTGSVESWTVAGAFGQRRFVALTPVLTIGLAAAWAWSTRTRPARVAFAILVGLCVWWNLALVAQFGSGLMNRQRLEPARNAYTAFVVLPRELPTLAWKYLFAREQFYRRGPVPSVAEPAPAHD